MADRAPPKRKQRQSTDELEPAQPINGEKKVAFKVNFKAVADGFEPRPAGEVDGTLIGHQLNAASENSGQPTLRLEWSENDSPNKKIFKTYSLQDKALWSLKRDLIRMGASVEEMNDEDADLEDIVTKLYGYSCTIKFGDPRPYKDKKTGEDKLGDNFLEVLDTAKV